MPIQSHRERSHSRSTPVTTIQKGAGVHAGGSTTRLRLAEALQIEPHWAPGVVRQVIDVGDGATDRIPSTVSGQRAGGRFEESES